jgi:diguanylate cyclase (GGDEF)-like protein
MGETTSAKPKAAPKRHTTGGRLTWFGGLHRLIDPSRWSLRGRFLYITGGLLVLGNLILIGYLYLILGQGVRDTARGQLDLLRMSVRAELDGLDKSLRAQAASLAEMPGVQAALAASAPDALSEMLLPYVNRARHALVLTSLELEVASGAEPGDGLGSSVLVRGDGVLAAASTPVRRGGETVGRVEARAFVWERLSTMELPVGMGLALVSTSADGTSRALHQRGTAADLGAPLPTPESGMAPCGDDCYAMSLGLGEGMRAVLSYDTSRLNESRWNKINLFIWFFLGGGLCLWIVLLLNVMRIERFFSRLKKIIISSHSNYFGERFESDNVHCLDVMHCHNEECPVYQNPSLTCYLETGSEAISPRWRDTCVYLNKYESCRNCPVYVMRKGDELTEMRNVVNTMMRLWGEFLGRVGHLLSYVLRSQGQGGGATPSLDDISDRLEQMAKLTFFGHDVQGVLDKEEVYAQLGHVFSQTFGLDKLVLFEVDNESDRLLVALDMVRDSPLCKQTVLMGGDACRACRVAEDVVSFYNPVLCPHFNCDLSKNVRVCMPVVMSGKVGAVASFTTSRSRWESLRQELPILRKYLDEAGPVLSSLKLLKLSQEQALRDPLTRCHNRRFLDEFITKYEPLIDREDRKTGLLMCDIDYFKQVNDTHGHEAGDAVLQQVVCIIQDNIRKSDLLIRYGGEEFLALLQNVEAGASMIVAEKIRHSVEGQNFELPGGNGGTINKTISIGVAEFPDDAGAMYKAIKFADVALYEAKNTGRNKVVRFEPEMWTDESY